MVFEVGVIIHFAFSNKLSKPDSTPFSSVPAMGCEPINNGCISPHVLIIGSFIEPTSVTIESFGIAFIRSLEGWIRSLIGNANIIREHSFRMPKSQLTTFARFLSIAFFLLRLLFVTP